MTSVCGCGTGGEERRRNQQFVTENSDLVRAKLISGIESEVGGGGGGGGEKMKKLLMIGVLALTMGQAFTQR